MFLLSVSIDTQERFKEWENLSFLHFFFFFKDNCPSHLWQFTTLRCKMNSYCDHWKLHIFCPLSSCSYQEILFQVDSTNHHLVARKGNYFISYVLPGTSKGYGKSKQLEIEVINDSRGRPQVNPSRTQSGLWIVFPLNLLVLCLDHLIIFGDICIKREFLIIKLSTSDYQISHSPSK